MLTTKKLGPFGLAVLRDYWIQTNTKRIVSLFEGILLIQKLFYSRLSAKACNVKYEKKYILKEKSKHFFLKKQL